MGTPSLPFHWRIKFKFWPGVFSWRKLRATCRTSQVGLCISGQHVCPFLKVLHRCTLCEAPHRVSHYHVVAAAFQSFILPCCLRGTWQSWFVRLHVWPAFQLELRARWIFRRRLKATILWLPRRLFVLHTLPGTHEKSRPSLNAYPFARRYGKRQEILTWKETLHGIAQCQRRHRNCKTSVETGSYSEAVFSRDFFWLQHFPSISGCGDSRVCSASCLQLCLLEFWQAMRFPLHDWRFWFCVFLDTHAQIFRSSLLHVCDRYAFFVDASLFIYAFICVYIHLHLYGLFMLYVHVSTAF